MSTRNLPTDPNQYKTFLLYTGYVESNAACPVVISMSRDHQFKEAATWKEAWEIAFFSMRDVFLKTLKQFHGFAEDGAVEPRDCCKVALKKKRPPRFCEDCGTNLRDLDSKRFPEDEDARKHLVYEVLSELHGATNDSWGGELWEFSDQRGWVIPGHMEPGVITIVHEHAERLLANYEQEKDTYLWNKDEQFWGSVGLMQTLNQQDP